MSMTLCKSCAALVTGLVLMAGLQGCEPTIHRDVKRVDPRTVVDVDYRFNDTDAREVWEKMSDDATFRGWIDRWISSHNGQRPTIIVGPVRNNTQDYINHLTFTRNFEREMLNSGRVRVVAARDDRPDLRDERMQGQEWNTEATRKQMKAELGADLMLMGDINELPARSPDGRTVVQYYQVNLDLTDLETNEKAWIGSVDVKKVSVDHH
jgi:PBP1b-binding outer membrane lipoprotein LpoB